MIISLNTEEEQAPFQPSAASSEMEMSAGPGAQPAESLHAAAPACCATSPPAVASALPVKLHPSLSEWILLTLTDFCSKLFAGTVLLLAAFGTADAPGRLLGRVFKLCYRHRALLVYGGACLLMTYVTTSAAAAAEAANAPAATEEPAAATNETMPEVDSPPLDADAGPCG